MLISKESLMKKSRDLINRIIKLKLSHPYHPLIKKLQLELDSLDKLESID